MQACRAAGLGGCVVTALAGHGRVLWPLVKLGYDCPRGPPCCALGQCCEDFGGLPTAVSLLWVLVLLICIYMCICVELRVSMSMLERRGVVAPVARLPSWWSVPHLADCLAMMRSTMGVSSG